MAKDSWAKRKRDKEAREAAAKAPRIERALWCPQKGPQFNAIMATWCPCIFYGGGKFSGKSDFLLGDYLQDLSTYKEHWQGIIFRRSLTEFTELKLRSAELFPKIGGVWHEQKSEWRFPNFGDKDRHAILRFRYLERLDDISQYEGQSYPWIGVDELGDWEEPSAFFRLFTFNRYGRANIPTKRIRATGNPGGVGHGWIKEYFIDPAPNGSKILFDEKLKSKYMFIFGTCQDNVIGMQNDPGYWDRMNRAGSDEFVRGIKYGDWNAIAGAFFNFRQHHIVEPFKIPNHWTKFMSMDYGTCGEADPFSIGWWAISDGATQDGDIHPFFQKGDLVRYREWYGKGLPKMTVWEIAEGIKKYQIPGEKISYRVAGGDIMQKRGTGPSVFEIFNDEGLYFQKADMRRDAGWQIMRQHLRGKADNRPTMYFFSTCTDSIANIPTLQHSKKDPNDLQEVNDHIAEEIRYAVTSRPWVEEPKEKKPVSKALTWNQLLEDNDLYEC